MKSVLTAPYEDHGMPDKTKQNHNQTGVNFRQGFQLCLLLCGLGTGVARAEPNKLLNADAATVDLVATGDKAGPAYQAGLAIVMKSGSHTYWKQPGDAGVPPTLTFDGSNNVAKAEVLYPVPSRIVEDGLAAFGYVDRVLFPLLVTPIDPAKPSTLHVEIAYAVCNKICLPVRGTAELQLPAKPSADARSTVEAALARVPGALPADERADLKVARVAGATPTWDVTWTGKTPLKDIFPEAPDGYSFDTKPGKQPNSWTLSETEPVGNGGKPLPVVLTLASGDRGFTVTEQLDVSPAKP